MDKANIVWSARIDVKNLADKSEEHEKVVSFIYDQLVQHSLTLKNIGFMGVVYGKNHVSVRVPGLLELAIARLYENHDDKYLGLSTQRLHLVDERRSGMHHLMNAFRSFNNAGRGIICWYGEDEFAMNAVSSGAAVN